MQLLQQAFNDPATLPALCRTALKLREAKDIISWASTRDVVGRTTKASGGALWKLAERVQKEILELESCALRVASRRHGGAADRFPLFNTKAQIEQAIVEADRLEAERAMAAGTKDAA